MTPTPGAPPRRQNAQDAHRNLAASSTTSLILAAHPSQSRIHPSRASIPRLLVFALSAPPARQHATSEPRSSGNTLDLELDDGDQQLDRDRLSARARTRRVDQPDQMSSRGLVRSDSDRDDAGSSRWSLRDKDCVRRRVDAQRRSRRRRLNKRHHDGPDLGNLQTK